jgi:hypothetical protein
MIEDLEWEEEAKIFCEEYWKAVKEYFEEVDWEFDKKEGREFHMLSPLSRRFTRILSTYTLQSNIKELADRCQAF